MQDKWMINMNKFMKTLTLLLMMGFLPAQDCEDDATGAFADMGGCSTVIDEYLVPCDNEFTQILVSEECPVSCDVCPYDCDANGNTSHGCCLPGRTIFLAEDGSVLYNTSTPVKGFQFTVNGDTVTGASGGAAEDAEFTVSVGNNIVLGFSFAAATFDGCGTMIELELDGEAAGLSEIVLSDANGEDLGFE